MERVLVTGADGFVGRAACSRLSIDGYSVVPVTRSSADCGHVAIGDLMDYRQWPSLLERVDVVIHLAARAHVLQEVASDPLEKFRKINVAPTLRLAEAAAAAGVARFIFVSSIGVNGMYTTGQAFRETDTPDPTEPYAVSKWEAERGLLEISERTGLQVTRIRPPLILGPHVKGNLRRLIRLVDVGLPLPLGAIANQRSFLALDDLCELLRLCIVDARAGNQLFLAASTESLSTPELLHRIARQLRKRVYLLPVPHWALGVAARLLGKTAEIKRLTTSLLIDTRHARRTLSWAPSVDGVSRSIASMVQSYLSEDSLAKV